MLRRILSVDEQPGKANLRGRSEALEAESPVTESAQKNAERRRAGISTEAARAPAEVKSPLRPITREPHEAPGAQNNKLTPEEMILRP